MLLQPYNRQPKLLILYASYGEGHIQAAKAIREACADYGNAQAVLYDLMAESHPWLNEMTKRFYLKSYTRMPYLYGWMYDMTRPMKHNSLFGNWLHSFGRQTITKILNFEKPDAVVYTFPFYALQALKGKECPRIPSYAVITDFDLHRRWVHPSIDRYYVATNDLRHELCQLGIRNHQVMASGMPLKKGFHATPESTELFERYGLQPNMPTILIMAGAQGVMPHVIEMCNKLLQAPKLLQIALVCGHNQPLQAAIQDHFALHPLSSRLHTYGFVHEMHELMSLADYLITKPGGITLAEAIATTLPTFIYRPVPGQEKQNALYLQSKGAAFVSHDIEELTDQLLQLLDDPLRLTNIRSLIRKLQPNVNKHSRSSSAAQSIVLDIMSNLNITSVNGNRRILAAQADVSR